MKTNAKSTLLDLGLIFIMLSTTLSCSKSIKHRAPHFIDLMSFNIRYGNADDGENAWPHRKNLVIDVISQARPDVLGVQEALHFQLVELQEALPNYARIGVGRDDGREAGEYAAILFDSTRFDLLAHDTFWFSETPEVPGSMSWGNKITRICSWALLHDRQSGREFYAYNVHWDHASQRSRERSAQLLLRQIEARSNTDAPVVVMGDFNAGEDNPAFLALQQHRSVHLQDSFRALHPEASAVGTFNGFHGTSDGPKIDAILLSSGFRAIEADIVRTHQNGRYPSDHFPVTARIAFLR